MALRRSARAGTTITLRARILDDLDDPAQASGLAIYLFRPDDDETDLTDAYATGTPTYFDQGIYEYEYSIPHSGPDGLWNDVWYATLNDETLSGTLTFEVSANGSISELGGQFNQNNIVDITVSSGILASDGSALEDDYEFSFLTEISPAYTDAMKLQIEIGSVIEDISDFGLYLSILEASLEADIFTFVTANRNEDFFQHARREWTTCRAAAVLASNVKNKRGEDQKTLGDFSVRYNKDRMEDLLDRVAGCLEKWEAQMKTGGYGTKHSSTFIKGYYDLDRPNFGRGWVSSEDGEDLYDSIPAANQRYRITTQRRWKKAYNKKGGGRWS